MKPLVTIASRILLIASWGWIASSVGFAHAQTNDDIRIIELRGTVEILPQGAVNWLHLNLADALHPHDRVRTGTNSSVSLIWSGQTPLRFSELTEMEILPPEKADDDHSLRLIQGLLYFFHRDKPGRIRIITSGAFAGVEGTEFTMQVGQTNGVEQTTLSVIDGKVRFSNNAGTLLLTNGDQAVAEPGQAPRRTAGFIANNLLQWCFYYPGVLDLNDLPPALRANSSLAESLSAYREGDLSAALEKYPIARQDSSEAERLYHAALLLSAGKIPETETMLATIVSTQSSETNQRLANALRTLIAAVKHEPRPTIDNYKLPTELLAGSYYEQSVAGPDSLARALQLAQRAVTNSPNFGFGWERVAELEFSFGRTERALAALNKALIISPRNAQALALSGFLLAAQNQPRAAIEQFNRALAVDSALGNAWLGRGLCRIRLGKAKAGREDLLIAAAMEPQRATLRSYLGKAFGDAGDTPHATHELQLAKQLDPNDPTAWLYSALMDEQNNQINDAIRDLEKSQALNDNRSVYRSGLLLDQDRAVRSANLARIYQEAGMDEFSVREASRAVNDDYANYSAHLFLANSYDAMRDPNGINLRYETPAESEYLIANLLAPVGAGTLSQSISQQEYSKLFERDRFGGSSDTEYLSRGAFNQSGTLFGTFGSSSYSFESAYHSDPGQRENGDLEQKELFFQFKQQLASKDTFYFSALIDNSDGGDLAEYYNQTNANFGLRTHEKQEPILVAGLNHEWSPGDHTLFLASRLNDRYEVYNPAQQNYLVLDPFGVGVSGAQSFSANQDYQSLLNIYSTELQQVWEKPGSTTIMGARYQFGDFKINNLQADPANLGVNVGYIDPGSPYLAAQTIDSDFQRISFYGYHYWQLTPTIQISGGFSYDSIRFPENFRAAPVSSLETSIEQWSPKAGFIWTPTPQTSIHFGYMRALSGASIDQSFLIEPSQVGGFNQSFRSIIPESVGGAEAGAKFEIIGLGLEQRFASQTYVTLTGQILNSHVARSLGDFEFNIPRFNSIFAQPATTPDPLDYTERSILININQLVGECWSIGTSYRLSEAKLNQNFSDIGASAVSGGQIIGFSSTDNFKSVLQQISLNAIYNNPAGFFVQGQALWNGQSSQGYQNYSSTPPDASFWQLNTFVGYRFCHRRAELKLGLLNLTDENYQLNPLTLYLGFPI